MNEFLDQFFKVHPVGRLDEHKITVMDDRVNLCRQRFLLLKIITSGFRMHITRTLIHIPAQLTDTDQHINLFLCRIDTDLAVQCRLVRSQFKHIAQHRDFARGLMRIC